MTEAELLERTRRLVRQARLPTTLGLGTTWIIILAASPRLPPLAAERYEEALQAYREAHPRDVVDFSHIQRTLTTRYLLLRAGSPAVTRWLSRPSS